MMPNDLPDWRLVYYYFRQWAQKGLVQQIHDKLVTKVRLQAGREASPSLGLVDSQSVKTISVTTLKGYEGNKHLTGGPPLRPQTLHRHGCTGSGAGPAVNLGQRG